jgi:hypothetical protein
MLWGEQNLTSKLQINLSPYLHVLHINFTYGSTTTAIRLKSSTIISKQQIHTEGLRQLTIIHDATAKKITILQGRFTILLHVEISKCIPQIKKHLLKSNNFNIFRHYTKQAMRTQGALQVHIPELIQEKNY